MSGLWTALALIGVAIAGALVQHARARRAARLEANREILAVGPPRSDILDRRPPLEPWTPAEREAFGVDATDRWIDETERVLNGIGWSRRFADVEPQEVSETIAVYAWGQREPVRTVAMTRQQHNDELPTINPERIFG